MLTPKGVEKVTTKNGASFWSNYRIGCITRDTTGSWPTRKIILEKPISDGCGQEGKRLNQKWYKNV